MLKPDTDLPRLLNK